MLKGKFTSVYFNIIKNSMKKIIFLSAFLLSTLFLSAAASNTYYVVTSDTVYGWRLPCTLTTEGINSIETSYRKNDVIYITSISHDNYEVYADHGYVKKDKVWVPMPCIRQLSEYEIARYYEKNKQHSKPLRTTLWILLALVVIGGAAMLFTDDPLPSMRAYFITILLCIVFLILFSYAQFIVCWGLKIVGWIEHYILGGWLVDSIANGILAIIPFVLDLTTYGLYGLFAGSIPMMAFHFVEKKFNNYSFTEWVVYFFRIMTLLAILIINNDGWYYARFNSVFPLDSVPGLSFLVEACDWGEYANTTFLWGYYIGLITLLFPKVLWKKIPWLKVWVELFNRL